MNFKDENGSMPTRREADEQLTQLRLDITKGFTGINTQLVTIHDNQQKLIDSMYGNGRDGLVTRVAKVETKQNNSSRIMIILITAFLGIAGYIVKISLIS